MNAMVSKIIEYKPKFESNILFYKKVLMIIILSLMVTYPIVIEFMYYKAFFLLLVILLIVYEIFFMQKKFVFSKKIFYMLIIYVAYSIFSALYGWYMGNVGWLKQAQIYILWPIVYVFIFFSFDREDDFKICYKTIIFSICYIILYGVLLFLYVKRYIDYSLSMNFRSIHNIVTIDGFVVTMGYPGIHSMAYCVGFVLGIFYLNIINKNKLFWTLLGCAIFTFFIYITGRRAYLLVLFLLASSMVLKHMLFVSKKHLIRNLLIIFGLMIGFLVFLWIIGINLVDYINYFIDSFSTADEGANIKFIQIKYLVLGWLENVRTFFIGSGHGSFIEQVVRSTSAPWSYEVYYAALLFQTGIIGAFIYCSFFAYIVIKGLRLTRRYENITYFLPFITGVITILIASGTNPYLMRYDSLWVLFIALAYINLLAVKNMDEKQIVIDIPLIIKGSYETSKKCIQTKIENRKNSGGSE